MKGAKGKGALSKQAEETNLKKKKQDVKGKKKAGKSAKGKQDPNKPKRPPSAFFVFMEDFRVTFKANHPGNKSISAVGKAGGEKWKSMSDAEKAPYIAKANAKKVQYEKSLKAYNAKQTSGHEGGNDSDKSKSEVNDDEEGSEEEEEEDDEE